MDRVVGHKVVKPNSASNLSASSFGVSNAQDTNINAEGRFCYNEELGIKPWSVTPQTTLRELLSILGIKPEMKRQIGNFGSASNIYSTNNTVGMSSVGTTDEADETERNESCKENRSCKEACEKSRKDSRKIRGVNKLRQSANCLLTIQLEEDGKPNGSIELFDSGHCIYDNGYSRTTIVDIANCTDFTYYFSVRETEKSI